MFAVLGRPSPGCPSTCSASPPGPGSASGWAWPARSWRWDRHDRPPRPPPPSRPGRGATSRPDRGRRRRAGGVQGHARWNTRSGAKDPRMEDEVAITVAGFMNAGGARFSSASATTAESRGLPTTTPWFPAGTGTASSCGSGRCSPSGSGGRSRRTSGCSFEGDRRQGHLPRRRRPGGPARVRGGGRRRPHRGLPPARRERDPEAPHRRGARVPGAPLAAGTRAQLIAVRRSSQQRPRPSTRVTT